MRSRAPRGSEPASYFKSPAGLALSPSDLSETSSWRIMLTPEDSAVLRRLANMTNDECVPEKHLDSEDRIVQRQLEFSLLTPERREREHKNLKETRGSRAPGNQCTLSNARTEIESSSNVRNHGKRHTSRTGRAVLRELQNQPSELAPAGKPATPGGTACFATPSRPGTKSRKASARNQQSRRRPVRAPGQGTTKEAVVVADKSRWSRARTLEEQGSPGDFRSLIEESPRHILRRPFEPSHPHWEILRLREALEKEKERAQAQEAYAASERAERCATEMAYHRLFQECNSLRQNVNHLEQALQILQVDLQEGLNDLVRCPESYRTTIEHRLREMMDTVQVAIYALRNETAYVRQPLAASQGMRSSRTRNDVTSPDHAPLVSSPHDSEPWHVWWPAQQLSPPRAAAHLDPREESSLDASKLRSSGSPCVAQVSRQAVKADERSVLSTAQAHVHMEPVDPCTSRVPSNRPHAAAGAKREAAPLVMPPPNQVASPESSCDGMPAPELLLFGNVQSTAAPQTKESGSKSDTHNIHGLLVHLDAS